MKNPYIQYELKPRVQPVAKLRQVIAAHCPDPGRLADIVSANLELRVKVAQDILAQIHPVRRLQKVYELLEREIDLIEEVARVHGFDQIPSTLPARRSGHGGLHPSQAALRRVEDLLVGAGLSQVITYSFGDEKWPERLRLQADDRRR